MTIDITALYCCLDDFRKLFEDWDVHRLIPSQTTRQRVGKLAQSERLFIMVLFHLSPFKHFKVFYHYGIGQQHRSCFGDLPHYDRFVSLMPRLSAPLMVLLHSVRASRPASPLLTQPSLPSVTTGVSTAIRSSKNWPHAARQAWARLAKGSGGVAVGMARRG